jgi:cytochrome c peroxidase
MKRSMLLITSAVCAVGVIAIVVGTRIVSAQSGTTNGTPNPDPDENPPFYNPYPPGILPADLQSEIDRVRREVRDLEAKALATSKTLPTPLVIAGNPPTIQGAGYQAVEDLGELLNFDENFSPFRNEACGFCHMPYAGFSGPIPSVNLTMIAYPGTFHFRAGKRTAQRYTYSPMFPVLEFNIALDSFFGGNFWDARATGYKLQSPDAEQAQHPPVDTQEMGFPDTACIAFRLQQAVYRSLFTQVWGDSLDIVFPPETEEICETPGGAAEFGTNVTPIILSPDDRTKANNVFDHWAQSVSFFEASPDVSAFSSKFDAFLDGNATLTADEMAGLKLFDGKGNCNSCHLDGRGTTLTPNLTDTSAPAASEPLFTCFGYANLGLPLNPRDAIFYQNKPDFFGFTPNPDGFAFRDLGVGTFLRSGPGSAPNPNFQWNQLAPLHDGQMQTSTARDVAMVPPQCPTTEAPGPYFQKEFFHNGYAKSLKQLVHFYNTRDVFPFKVTSGHCTDIGKTEKVDCWPMPEVPNNIDMTVGKLGLSDHEENLIVIFLQTLTDGFITPYPDINTFTGKCMSGGNASTQGNEFLIPTPPLPPCAADVCGVAPTPGPSPIP